MMSPMSKSRIYLTQKLECLKGLLKWSSGIVVGLVSYLAIGLTYEGNETLFLASCVVLLLAFICMVVCFVSSVRTLNQLDVTTANAQKPGEACTKVKATSKASFKSSDKIESDLELKLELDALDEEPTRKDDDA